MRHFRSSLYFKIGAIIIIVELIILLLLGSIYINLFSNQIDLRSQERANLPGHLVQRSILRLVSIGDSTSMRQIVGEDLSATMLVDKNLNIVYSLNSAYNKQNVSDVTELNPAWFNFQQPTETLEQIEETHNIYLVKLTPINNPITNEIEFYLYVKISTNHAEAEKQQIGNYFLLGSAAAVIMTSLLIFIVFYSTILRRLSATLKVVKTVEAGDLSVRIKNTHSQDEIGTLQAGVNAMITQLAGLVGSLEDKVTERTRQLEQARQQAEKASNAKSEFLSNMSHELRTPLNMVIGYTSSMLHMPQMYQNQELPEVFRADIQLIQENGQYLLTLINDILDLSKIEAGKFELQFSAVDVNAVLTGVIATATGLLKEKPVHIRPDFPPDLPPVWADPLRMRQILLNLMSNAIKFTDTGSVTLSAQMQGDEIIFSVTDTGIGMSGEALKVIFDRFEQVMQKDVIQGTGLGLDISQRLAHMHDTELTVKSAIGQGTTFLFSLRLATAEQVARSSNQPTIIKESTVKVLEPSTWDASANQTILLVEDDANSRLMLRRILESTGYILLDASDGTQGLDLATGILPDLIIIDLMLPDMSGWDLIEKLRAEPAAAAIPLVILSHALDPEKVAQFNVALALDKTIDPGILLQNIQRILSVQQPIED
jgi:signal transduction histidine kinase